MNDKIPIDAVITWVDGNDPLHQRKMSLAVSSEKKKKNNLSKYKEAGEIYYCVQSIIKFAPFIRNIFIVTDNQVPLFIKNKKIHDERIKVVDHKEIFKGLEEYMPTFNPRGIDALLHRVPGLSERFIYFNDDMFLIKKTQAKDWFTVAGKPVLRGKWSKSYNTMWHKKIAELFYSFTNKRPSYNLAQSVSANMAGFNNRYYRSFHSGRPLLKSVFEEYFKKNPQILRNQLKYKFRNRNQFMPYSLGWHLMIKNGGTDLKSNIGLKEITNIKRNSTLDFEQLLNNVHKNPKVFSLNIQDLHLGSKSTQDCFKRWMNNLLGII